MKNVLRCGLTAENVQGLVMKTYCKKAGTEKADRIYQLEKLFKYLLAANYLLVYPQFGGQCDEEEKGEISNIMVRNKNIGEDKEA